MNNIKSVEAHNASRVHSPTNNTANQNLNQTNGRYGRDLLPNS